MALKGCKYSLSFRNIEINKVEIEKKNMVVNIFWEITMKNDTGNNVINLLSESKLQFH